MTSKETAISPVYTRYFEFLRAERREILNMAYRIRYQVYCEERGFLDPSQYPERVEIDQYDTNAVQILGRHRFKSIAAGTVRLVLPSERGFPLQGHCRFDPEFAFISEPGHPSLRRWVEISRLAVSKVFRQRVGDTPYGGPPRTDAALHPLPAFDPLAESGVNPVEAGPEIVAGLFKSVYQESRRRGLTHMIVAMERSLHLLLKRMGYHFRPIGPLVDYYGPVAPYVARICDLEQYLYTRRRAVYNYWIEGLSAEFRPAPPDKQLQLTTNLSEIVGCARN